MDKRWAVPTLRENGAVRVEGWARRALIVGWALPTACLTTI